MSDSTPTGPQRARIPEPNYGLPEPSQPIHVPEDGFKQELQALLFKYRDTDIAGFFQARLNEWNKGGV